MINPTLRAEQAKKAVYSKPSVTELNSQATAGGAAGPQELSPTGMNPNRKMQSLGIS